MSEWQSMETAPRDGTVIQVEIPNHRSDNMVYWLNDLVDDDGNFCGNWAFAYEQEPPECWSDGICWQTNEEGKPSIKPTRWKPAKDQPHD